MVHLWAKALQSSVHEQDILERVPSQQAQTEKPVMYPEDNASACLKDQASGLDTKTLLNVSQFVVFLSLCLSIYPGMLHHQYC